MKFRYIKLVILIFVYVLTNVEYIAYSEEFTSTSNSETDRDVLLSDIDKKSRSFTDVGAQIPSGNTRQELLLNGVPDLNNHNFDDDWWLVANHIFTRKLLDLYLKSASDSYVLGFKNGDSIEIPLILQNLNFSSGFNGNIPVNQLADGSFKTFYDLVPSMRGSYLFLNKNNMIPFVAIDWEDIPKLALASEWKNNMNRSAFSINESSNRYLKIDFSNIKNGIINDTVSYRLEKRGVINSLPQYYLIFERTQTTFTPLLNNTGMISGTLNYRNSYDGANSQYTLQKYNWNFRDPDSREGKFSPKLGITSIIPSKLSAHQDVAIDLYEGQSLKKVGINLNEFISVSGGIDGSNVQISTEYLDNIFANAGEYQIPAHITETLDGVSRSIDINLNINVKRNNASLETKDLTVKLGEKIEWNKAFLSATDEDGNNISWKDNRILVNGGNQKEDYINTSRIGDKKYSFSFLGKVKTIESTFTVKVIDSKAQAKLKSVVTIIGEEIDFKKLIDGLNNIDGQEVNFDEIPFFLVDGIKVKPTELSSTINNTMTGKYKIQAAIEDPTEEGGFIYSNEVSISILDKIVPPKDPLDPNFELTPADMPNIPTNQGLLSIDFVSQFNFGKQLISIQEKTYFAKEQNSINLDGTQNKDKNPNYVQISDRRSESDRNGWQLSVTQNEQFMNKNGHELRGANLIFMNQQLVSDQSESAEPIIKDYKKLVLIPKMKSVLLTAPNKDVGIGTWIYRFGDSDTADESVALNIPEGSNPEMANYSTILNWELNAVPDN